jgi:hypothetical protein
MLQPLIDSLRTVVSAANDRMHVMHAQGHITLPELMSVQAHISTACDHLDLASDLAEAIDNQIEAPNHPDQNDRDAGRICEQCNHDLELDADFRCTRCGA